MKKPTKKDRIEALRKKILQQGPPLVVLYAAALRFERLALYGKLPKVSR